MTDRDSFKHFCKELSEVFPLGETQLTRLAEILDDRMKEIADKQASDALDREFNRGDWRG